MSRIVFVELFAGIGGFRHGLEKANDTITEGTQQGIQQGGKNNSTTFKPLLGSKQFTCVWANEWNKYACQIYRKNFGEGELYEGDIKGITAETIPDHGLLTAGFPCPTYSIAGKQKGFDDPRGIVFFEICRIAEVKKPRLLLLENVKGLLNHKGGETFAIILNSLSELGYDCEWEVLNSKNFGVPQNRERVFIVGHLRGTGGQKIFPIEKGNQIFIEKQNKMSYSTAITGNYRKGVHSGGETYINENVKIRRLTPIECERLQGFPDGWTEGISDTQRYKCLGNAVTINVIREIGRKLIND